MILKPSCKAGHFFLLFVLLFFASCQANNSKPVVPADPTGPPHTPTVFNAEAPKALPSTYTPTPLTTVAVQPDLAVGSGQFNGLEIDFWHPWSGQTGVAANTMVEEFNRTNEWGIKVRATAFYSAGALFDAVQGGAEQEPGRLPQVVAAPEDQLAVWSDQKDIVFPLDSYIAHSEFGISEESMGAFVPAYLEQARKNNRQVGIPVLRSANVIFYNQSWARELGFPDPPKTPAEFKEQACAAAISNNTAKILEKYGTGGWLIDTDPLTIISWLDAFNAKGLPEEDGQGYTFNNKEGQAALVYLRGMLNDGCAWLQRSTTPDDFFAERMAIFFTGSLQDVFIQKRINEMTRSQDEWILLPYPRVDGSGVVYSNGYSLALFGKLNQDKPDQKKKREAAWLFIRWMVQPENLERLAEQLPSLPVSSEVDTLLEAKKDTFPWNLILQLRKSTQPAPTQSSWRTVRRMVEDAGWQIFHLPADQVSFILPQLDESVKELNK